MSDFVRARDNYTGEEQMVSPVWLERWPEDYTVLGTEPAPEKPVPGPKPSDGKHEKEQG